MSGKIIDSNKDYHGAEVLYKVNGKSAIQSELVMRTGYKIYVQVMC